MLGNPLVLIGGGVLVALLVLLLLIVALRRRRRRAKSESPAAPETQPPTESSSAASLTSLIGEAKVPTLGEYKPAMSKSTATRTTAPASSAGVASSRSDGKRSDKAIRILIVDDNKDTRDHVARLLTFEEDMNVIGQAYNGISGLAMAKQYQPHIVLMDINMPDMDGITATHEMTLQIPYCQIIIISVQFETDYMRSAMLAGARDYQTKPFYADELISCIRRVYEAAQPHYRQIEEAQRPPEVAIIDAVKPTGAVAPFFMLYSPKGGTGKSAVAINLAAALQREHPGASLIDADLQWGDLPIWLGLRPAQTMADLVKTGIPDAELLPKIMAQHSSGVKLLSAPPKPEMAEMISGNMLIQAARQVRDRSSAVVLDTASYLSDHTLALMDISNLVLLVVTPDLPSVKNMRIFRDMASMLGLKPEQQVLVINRANRYGALPAEKIASALNLPRFFAIPEDPKLRLALLKGQSVFELDAAAPAAQAISALARGLWDLITAPKPAAEEGMATNGKSAIVTPAKRV